MVHERNEKYDNQMYFYSLLFSLFRFVYN